VVYYVVYYVMRYRKDVVRENIRSAFPEKSEVELLKIEKEFYRHFCDLNLEILKIAGLTSEELRNRVRFKNPEVINYHTSNNTSMIAVTAHQNNWEWGGLALSDAFPGIKVLGVYKPINNEKFDKFFRNLRSKFGMDLVPMKSTLRAILKNNSRVTVTTLVADQTPTLGETEFVMPFLGRTVPVFLGAEKIARLTKYPVLYFAMRKLKRGFYEVEAIPVTSHPENLNPFDITKKHVRLLEKEIAVQPAYWLWSHRRWKHSGKTWPDSVVVG